MQLILYILLINIIINFTALIINLNSTGKYVNNYKK